MLASSSNGKFYKPIFRYYQDDEFGERLPKIFEFYEKYSKVFPNYVNLPESKYMFKNIERKQKMIDDKQNAINCMQRVKEKKKTHFSDLLADDNSEMFSSGFMNSILKQDAEISKIKQQQEINERFVKAVQEFVKNDSVMDDVNKSDITAHLSMSEMDIRENSDLSCIKSEATQDPNQSSDNN